MEHGSSTVWCYIGDAEKDEGMFGKLEKVKGIIVQFCKFGECLLCV